MDQFKPELLSGTAAGEGTLPKPIEWRFDGPAPIASDLANSGVEELRYVQVPRGVKCQTCRPGQLCIGRWSAIAGKAVRPVARQQCVSELLERLHRGFRGAEHGSRR